MILFKLLTIILVISPNLSKSKVPVVSLIILGNEIEAKLHTAISSFEENSTISVQRFEFLIVPKFF